MTEQTNPTPAFLHVDGVTKSYAGAPRPSVSNIDLSLARGEMLALLGPSGCGKTTLLRIIAGLLDADAGRIRIDGQDMTGVALHRRDISMVFQSYALFPHLNVARNVAFGLEVRGVPAKERAARVEAMLALTKLDGLADRRIHALSGGQQQRVALARALVTNPRLLLLDEPLANLDVKLRETMRAEIRALQRRLGVTTVFVTHDQAEALASADRVAVMSDGAIRQIGTPREIYDAPANRFVAEFIGRANFLEVARGADGCMTIAGVGSVPATPAFIPQIGDAPRTVMLRPQHLRLIPGDTAPADGRIYVPGIVEDLVFGGDLISYSVRAGSLLLLVEQHAHVSPAIAPGGSVQLAWDWADATPLEAEG